MLDHPEFPFATVAIAMAIATVANAGWIAIAACIAIPIGAIVTAIPIALIDAWQHLHTG